MNTPARPPLDFHEEAARYQNTATHNDAVFAAFTQATERDPLLSRHRTHVEHHRLGTGERAFHSLWAGLLAASARRFGRTRALEIGVFKGQIISLWALLAREYGLDVEVHALTPLAGNPASPIGLWNSLRLRFDRAYRQHALAGNHYAEEDYEAVVRAHFAHHRLSFEDVRLHRGYSTDPAVVAALDGQRFEIVYVDGDHREAGARHDFATYGAKVVPGGWLVADDASHDLPGTTFWKGYPQVTSALSELAPLGFVNVLNVGHNRVFERRSVG